MAVPRTDRNKVELVGEVAGPPRDRQFGSGSTLLSFSVRTRRVTEDGTVTENVPVAWWNPGAEGEGVEDGRRVRVLGYVRRRFFLSGSGVRSVVEVVAAGVEV